MMFPPGYRDLKSYRVFKQLSGLAHPIEAIFTLHNEIQISGGKTVCLKDDEEFLYLLGITEEGITGQRIKNALLRSGMLEETEDPHVFYAKEFCELNKALFSSRNNGGLGGRKKRTHEEIKESTEEPINRRTNERRDEGTNERMNGQVTNRLPTGNPQVTHGYRSNSPEDWEDDDDNQSF